MTCSTDRNKIQDAVVAQVQNTFKNSNSFREDNGVYFPIEKSNWKGVLDSLKTDYGQEVTSPVDNGYKIDIPKEIIDRYIFSQEGTGKLALERIRQTYLESFSGTSLNLLAGNLWLNHPVLEDVTTQKLFAFAKKINPNFKIGVVENLDEKALSLIQDHIIAIKDIKFIDELPEEVSHFFVALLPENSPLLKRLLSDVLDHDIYRQTYHTYKDDPNYQKDGKTNLDKIKREAAAKLIGEYIKNAFNDEADKVYGNKRGKLRELVDKIIKFLREQFIKLSSAVYSEPTTSLDDPFQTAAEYMLKGDTSILDLRKEVSAYDSVFFSKVVNNTAEPFEGAKEARELHLFSKDMKIRVQKSFFKFIESNELKGLKELLNDKKYSDFNKVWNIINLLKDAELDFGRFKDNPEEINNANLISATVKLADAYHAMQSIPDAVKIILDELRAAERKGNMTENEIINNITEVQRYLQFSDTFKGISDQFMKMLSYVEKFEFEGKEKDANFNLRIPKMIEKMGEVQIKFNLMSSGIMNVLKNHLLDLITTQTKDYFEKYSKEINDKDAKLEHFINRKNLLKQLKEQITNPEMLRAVFMNDFAGIINDDSLFDPVTKQNVKWNISKIKDLSTIDRLIFMVGATSTMADPFVSNAMMMFADELGKASARSLQEELSFSGRVMPFFEKLSKLGVGYYEAQSGIQSIQERLDPVEEGGTFKIRTIMTDTNSINMNADRLKLYEERNKLNDEIFKKREILNRTPNLTDEQKETLKSEIEELSKKREEHTDIYNKFLAENSYRDYTDDFYEKQRVLNEGGADKELSRKLRANFAEINRLTQLVDQIQAQSDLDYELYMHHAAKLGPLYDERRRLIEQLPEREKEDFKKYDELYEPDKVATEHMVGMHKTTWISNYMRFKMADTENRMTIDELRDLAERLYDEFNTLYIPTEDYWNMQSEIMNDINALQGSSDALILGISKRQEDLVKKRAKILKASKDLRSEVSMFAVRYGTDNNKLRYQELKDIDRELGEIRTKLNLISLLQNKSDKSEVETVGALADTTSSLNRVILEFDTITPADIVSSFSHNYDLSESQANAIKSLLGKAAESSDPSYFGDLKSILLSTAKNDAAKYVITNFFSNLSYEQILDKEEAFYDVLKKYTKIDSETRDAIQEKYAELDELRTNRLSWDYIAGPLMQIRDLALRAYDNADDLGLDSSAIARKLDFLRGGNVQDVEGLEALLGDGFFEQILKYLDSMDNKHPNDEIYRETSNFLQGIHTTRKRRQNGEFVTYHTPMSYLRKVDPGNPLHVKKEVPSFLKRTKVKQEYKTPKIYRDDPEVLAGNKQPTVDLNGRWLPLPNSKYRNEQYHTLKNGTDEKSKLQFGLLQQLTKDYYSYQREFLPEGERLDTVIPARHIDHYENIKLHITNLSEWKKNLREVISTATSKDEGVSAETVNYNEQLGIATKENREIYSGLVIREQGPKIESGRKIPIQRVSQDIFSNIIHFIGDANQFQAKNVLAPVFKSYAEVFRKISEENPTNSKYRAEVFEKLLSTKIYGEVPKGWANNKLIAKAVSIFSSMAVRKLLGDPLGALINLGSGEVQQLIETAYGKRAMVDYAETGALAARWSVVYGKDLFQKNKLGKESQISTMFSFIPDKLELSERMSEANIYSNWKGALMSPRSMSEIAMGIHLGLLVLRSHTLTHEGKDYNVEDIYHVNPATGLLEILPELAKDQELVKKFNPYDGTEVVKIRREVLQKYTLIQGNYFKMNQSFISHTAIGRTAELMKRWFVSGYVRRFQGNVLDPFLQEDRVGFHWALLKVVKEAILSFTPNFEFKLKGKTITNKNRNAAAFAEYWKLGRTQKEMEGFRKSIGEMTQLVMIGLFMSFVLGYDSDDPDKNKKLKQYSYWKQILILTAMRMSGEMGTFVPLPMWGLGLNETWRALLDPLSSIKNTVFGFSNIATLLVYHLEELMGVDKQRSLYYQQNGDLYAPLFGNIKEKGDSKLLVAVLKLIGYTGYTARPAQYIKTLDAMQNKMTP